MEHGNFNDWQVLYRIVADRLISYEVVTREQCDTIARKGHRKERYWKRHIVDLCEFVLGTIERKDIFSPEAAATCRAALRIVKVHNDEIQKA